MSEPEVPTGPAVPTTPDVPGGGAAPPGLPQRIGPYRVERVLGQGGFGVVYLAHDDQLHRPVAIKVPHRERVSAPEHVEAYLAEARILASLDHPHIVPVHDVGTTEDGLPFVVSKVIEGSDLKQQIRGSRPSFSESAALVATVAEALHYAHLKGLVHRDVKPGNILMDAAGKPYVADFGLALKEEDFGSGPGFAGTVPYMSPEQARGEGHRVDGRSDIFSLGVVFYELLTGRRPFRGKTRDELLEQITGVEARPPRQVDDAIPKELECICLKALSKQSSERYTTAKDMADGLRGWLVGQAENPARNQTAAASGSGNKGLRSFLGRRWAASIGVGVGLLVLIVLTRLNPTNNDLASHGPKGSTNPTPPTERRPVMTGSISGGVTFRGAPILRGTVTFHPLKGGPVIAQLKEAMYRAKDVPIGETRVTVEIEHGSWEKWARPVFEKVGERYKDPDTTPLVCNVKSGNQEFIIEMEER